MSYPHSRIYWSVMDDEKFDGVREDVRHFGTWSLMLVVADMAWPAPAFIPPVPRASVALLSDRGLVDLLPGGRYRIHGLDNEREQRQERARANASGRASSRRAVAEQPLDNGSATALLAEQSREQKSKAEQGEDAAVVYMTLFGGRPSNNALQWIDRLSITYGAVEAGNAIAQAVKDGVERNRVLGVAESYLADQERRRLQTRKPRKVDPWREELRAKIEAGYAEPEDAA